MIYLRKNLFRTSKFSLITVFISLFLFNTFAIAQKSGDGKITGKLVDSNSGEPLIGANVFLDNTTLGAATDLDGYYMIPAVPKGNYTLITMMIGYAETRVQNIGVKSGEVISIDLALDTEILTTDVVIVEAKAVSNTEAALLGKRQKSVSVSDAISAEAISRSGSGDAASAMKMVTGASVVGGKYVFVRGLGERYSSTHLNGAELPSADPDKKAVQMDLFPSNLLDNIVTVKTFTPDKPGNFSGGIVDIGTKSFPEKFSLKFSSSTSYNSQTTFNDNYISYTGGGRDWLGYDDGTRNNPVKVSDIPSVDQAQNDASLETAKILDQMSDAYSNIMAPTTSDAPVNQNYSISIGNQTEFLDNKLGYLGNVTYSNNYSYYDDGVIGKYILSGNINTKNELDNEWLLNEEKGVHEVSWGALMNLSYKLGQHHEIHSNFLYSKSGESSARYINGKYNEGTLDPEAIFETRVLRYTERDLYSSQFRGEHFLPNLFETKIEWIGSYAFTKQAEPDMRFFSDHYFNNADGSRTYKISPAVYPVPARYYRDLNEDNYVFELNLSTPFKQWDGLNGKVKIGGAFSKKERENREERVKFNTNDQFAFDGNPASYFSSANKGLVYNPDGSVQLDNNGKPVLTNWVTNATEDRSNYNGDQMIVAGFAMVELPLFSNLRFVGGARLEKTDMLVETVAEGFDKGEIDELDLLPSVNLIYNLSEKMNLRGSFGRTLARPTIREISQFPSEDFAAGNFISGNPDLKRTLIDNFDVRWEWFERPGEIYAISGFYKIFTNPIERVIRNENKEIRYENVDEATLIGAEFEVRKKLDQIHPYLSNFSAGGNFSLIYSNVDISATELQRIRVSIPNASSTRELQGQSPYLINLNLLYDLYEAGTSMSLYYNIFGERLSEISLGATPDIYEQPKATLNFNYSQRLFEGFNVSLAARNILNSPVKKVYHFKGQDYVYQEYKTGMNISVGLNYTM
jgi:outer membrane receptor protein involved in Fe transport